MGNISRICQNLFVNGKNVAETEPSITNYYKFPIDAGKYEEGIHKYYVQATLEGGATINSITQTVDYNAYGAWIRIDNFDYGDFAYDRPIIKGSAGYAISDAEIIASKKKGGKDLKEDIAQRKVVSVDLSLNNGRTFSQISKSGKWSYRIENDDLAESPLPAASFKLTRPRPLCASSRLALAAATTKTCSLAA